MKITKGNPSTNILTSGINEYRLNKAITSSGYPLQTIISNSLRKEFSVLDEWSYIDRDTGELRTIDILAQLPMYDSVSHLHIRPKLTLIVECKQSELPYVFFLCPERPYNIEFPLLAGLGIDKIEVTTDDSASIWEFDPMNLLELDEHKFYKDPNYCSTFSKCVRKGQEIELSGSEAYNNLILPLVKSLIHFKNAEKPIETFTYFDSFLTIGLGILNAPMVGVKITASGNENVMIPWVRVIRHEYVEDIKSWDKSKLYAIDVVHKDYFEKYLSNHVLPFAHDFASLALKHEKEISSGKGFISGLSNDGWADFEKRLMPRGIKENSIRTKNLFLSIGKAVLGKKIPD